MNLQEYIRLYLDMIKYNIFLYKIGKISWFDEVEMYLKKAEYAIKYGIMTGLPNSERCKLMKEHKLDWVKKYY